MTVKHRPVFEGGQFQTCKLVSKKRNVYYPVVEKMVIPQRS